jgi:hypothetical protein
MDKGMKRVFSYGRPTSNKSSISAGTPPSSADTLAVMLWQAIRSRNICDTVSMADAKNGKQKRSW